MKSIEEANGPIILNNHCGAVSEERFQPLLKNIDDKGWLILSNARTLYHRQIELTKKLGRQSNYT